MKAKFNSQGHILIQRAGIFVEQFCPRYHCTCGHWCPCCNETEDNCIIFECSATGAKHKLIKDERETNE